MRIVLLSAEANPVSGWGTMTHNYCRALMKAEGVEFTLLLPREATIPDVPFADRIHSILPAPRTSFRMKPWQVVPFLWPRPHESGDLIHTLVEYPYGVLAWRLARRAGLPYVISGQGTYSVLPLASCGSRLLFRPALRAASCVTLPSEFTRGAMTSHAGGGIETRVIPNPVDVEAYGYPINPGRVCERWGLPDGARFLFSVGALKRRKGFDVLLEAFASVARRRSDVHLVIAGSGDPGQLIQRSEDLGMRRRVHFVGLVAQEELRDLYAACELFVLLPRREGWRFEGFGLVYLEAGAAGKPVVGTRSGGVPDAVSDGETGLLVDEEDAEGAADAILRILREEGLADRLGRAGRVRAEELSWPRYVEEMTHLYRRIVEAA